MTQRVDVKEILALSYVQQFIHTRRDVSIHDIIKNKPSMSIKTKQADYRWGDRHKTERGQKASKRPAMGRLQLPSGSRMLCERVIVSFYIIAVGTCRPTGWQSDRSMEIRIYDTDLRGQTLQAISTLQRQTITYYTPGATSNDHPTN